MGGAPLEGRVSLVIPTRNGGELFGRVLDAWRSQQGVGTLDIVCPDTASRDGTQGRLRGAGARTMAIAPGQFNHGETRNRAVAATKTEFVILSVQDALPLSASLAAELVAPLVADPSLSASYGRQRPRADCHPLLAARIGGWAGGTEAVVQALEGRAWDDLSPVERLQLVRYDHVIACMRRAAWERQRFERAHSDDVPARFRWRRAGDGPRQGEDRHLQPLAASPHQSRAVTVCTSCAACRSWPRKMARAASNAFFTSAFSMLGMNASATTPFTARW
jgi:glycosyltransferase involved in cell wall biosynthesis